MLAKSIHEYYYFGTVLRYLQDVRTGFHIHGKGYAIDNLDIFFSRLKDLDLQVTSRASYKLRAFLEALRIIPNGQTFSEEQAAELRSLMRDIRLTLEAELRGLEAYVITPKRLDVKRLVSDVSSLMAPRIYDQLPTVAKYDFSEAGKCIAFERPTAAAFQILRGTESVLRNFYCSLVKRNRCDLMWGPMVGALRKKRTLSPEALLQNLDNIRRLFRNPTMHPEKIFDIQEVQDLFALCVDVVNRMVTAKGWQKILKPNTSDPDINAILSKILEMSDSKKGKEADD